MSATDVVVLGGGAAGLMCAIAAGQRGRRVVVLEGSNRIGKKILMSGGGRCNFTNLNTRPDHFLSANPHFCKSALSRYSPQDFVDLVEAHGIAYHEKAAGQLFCDDSSKQIVAMLKAECDQAGVLIYTDSDIGAINVFDGGYQVRSQAGDFLAESLVVATGGLSIPRMGASDFGFRIAKQFDLTLRATRAGLVPLTFSGIFHDMLQRLSGVSVASTMRCGKTHFDEDLLFTHRGLSGPAALQISSYWRETHAVDVDLMPGQAADELLMSAKKAQPKVLLRTLLGRRLPKALVAELEALYWPERAEEPLAQWPDRRLSQISQTLSAWTLKPSGTEGYRTAEVTLGGVDTNELSSTTMESNQHPGLYFIGEVVDVTGHLGGFNFQWAWASAQAAGAVV
ncbi:MAG: NAD(P)/FAD-dependent oxidoreductase [Lysobacterales bacterium]